MSAIDRFDCTLNPFPILTTENNNFKIEIIEKLLIDESDKPLLNSAHASIPPELF